MKVLLITDTSSERGADGEATPKREGVPCDYVITSSVAASDPSGCTSTLPSLSSIPPGGTQVANDGGVVIADSRTSVAVKPKAPTPIISLGEIVAVQVRPKTVSITKKGKITVSPAHGRTPAGLGPSLPSFIP